jgi:hypothetical protein
MLAGHGLIHLIKDITRPLDGGGSILDHIATNTNVINNISKVIAMYISDHYGTYTQLNIEDEGLAMKCRANICDTLPVNLYLSEYAMFNELLQQEQWAEVYESNDVNRAYTCFISTLNLHKKDIINKRKSSRKPVRRRKEWIGSDTVQSIKYRDKLHKRIQNEPLNDKIKKEYDILNKNIKKAVLNGKRLKKYYASQFDSAKNAPH